MGLEMALSAQARQKNVHMDDTVGIVQKHSQQVGSQEFLPLNWKIAFKSSSSKPLVFIVPVSLWLCLPSAATLCLPVCKQLSVSSLSSWCGIMPQHLCFKAFTGWQLYVLLLASSEFQLEPKNFPPFRTLFLVKSVPFPSWRPVIPLCLSALHLVPSGFAEWAFSWNPVQDNSPTQDA